MKSRRIVAGVFVGCILLATAVFIIDRSFWRGVVKSGLSELKESLEERLMPEEWQVGEVSVERGYFSFNYYLSLDDEKLKLSVPGRWYPEPWIGIGGTVSEWEWAYITSSPQEIRKELPEPLSGYIAPAKEIASEMCRYDSLAALPLRRAIRNIDAGKFRIEVEPGETAEVRFVETLWGDQIDRSFTSFPPHHIEYSAWLRLRDDGLYGKAPQILFRYSDAKLDVYPDDEEAFARFMTSMPHVLDSLIQVLKVSPEVTENPHDCVAELCEAVREKRFRRNPPMEDEDERLDFLSPWVEGTARIVDWGLPSITEENVLKKPIDVGGVRLREIASKDWWPARLEMSYEDLKARLWFSKGKARLQIEDEIGRSLSVNVTGNREYPEATAQMSEDPQRLLDGLMQMAQEIIDVPQEEWPDIKWHKELKLVLEAVLAGRFTARASPVTYGLCHALVGEGESVYAVFSEYAQVGEHSIGFPIIRSMDLAVREGGFTVYDHRSCSFLTVEGTKVSLQQSPQTAADGFEFDLATFLLLAEYAMGFSENLPAELNPSWECLRDFTVEVKLPEPQVDAEIDVPDWSMSSPRRAFVRYIAINT